MLQEFVQQLDDTTKRIMAGMHTAIPGTIVELNTDTGLAVVQPKMKYRKPNGETMDYPNISGVPVIIPQSAGQNVTIAFPIKAGDGGLIVVAEQSLDYWMYGQETGTNLRFDLSNSIFIPGLFPAPNPALARACETGSVVMKGNVIVEGTITATGDVTGAGVSLVQHTHNGDSGGKTSPPV